LPIRHGQHLVSGNLANVLSHKSATERSHLHPTGLSAGSNFNERTLYDLTASERKTVLVSRILLVTGPQWAVDVQFLTLQWMRTTATTSFGRVSQKPFEPG
jgi:hypothetical protein